VRIKALDLLAELQDPALLSVFQSALLNEYWEMRAAAAQALGALRIEQLAPFFLAAFREETDEIVQQALVRATGKSRSEKSIPFLTYLLRDQEQNVLVREAAAWALGEFGEKAPVLALREALQEDSDEIVRDTAAKTLESLQAGTRGTTICHPAPQ
jgi:HEAT repeat protein